MRLNRYLALHGYSSRRKAEELIKAGRVSLNGEICTELATKVDPATDKVSVDGMEIKSSGEKLYLILNKPKATWSRIAMKCSAPPSLTCCRPRQKA